MRSVLGAAVAALVVAISLLLSPAANASPSTAGQGAPVATVGVTTTTLQASADEGATVASKEDPIVAAGSGERFLTEDRKLFAIVGGLIVVAIALTLLTVRYWRRTKPIAPVEPAYAPRHAAGAAKPDPEPSASIEESAKTDVVPAVDPEPEVHAPVTAAAIAVADEPSGGTKASRRAVAGADHRGADADWEPRGTGEHERVEITAGGRGSRPGRDIRKAALTRTDPDD